MGSMSSKSSNLEGGSQGASVVARFVEPLIENEDVLILSKSYCPYCTAAKETLKKEVPSSLTIKTYELDQGHPDFPAKNFGEQLQGYIKSTRNQSTVPMIFIGGKFIGGNDDLKAKLKNKTVDNLLKQVEAKKASASEEPQAEAPSEDAQVSQDTAEAATEEQK